MVDEFKDVEYDETDINDTLNNADSTLNKLMVTILLLVY